VAAARKNSVPVGYVSFPTRATATKKKNQIDGWKAVLEFLDKYLKAAAAAPAKAA
jgi:hypothetical protein